MIIKWIGLFLSAYFWPEWSVVFGHDLRIAQETLFVMVSIFSGLSLLATYWMDNKVLLFIDKWLEKKRRKGKIAKIYLRIRSPTKKRNVKERNNNKLDDNSIEKAAKIMQSIEDFLKKTSYPLLVLIVFGCNLIPWIPLLSSSTVGITTLIKPKYKHAYSITPILLAIIIGNTIKIWYWISLYYYAF